MHPPLNYPLTLTFKIVAVAPQLSVTDRNGQLIAYVKQKLFKLKEAVTVFADQQQSRPLYTMKADRVIDFSARYHFANGQGLEIGSVKRQGMRSIWKARYDIFEGETPSLQIQEEDPWVKVIDSLVGEIPLVGMFSGYFLHPAFQVVRTLDDTVVMRLEKQPSFFEGVFKIEKKAELSPEEEQRVLLSLIMMVLLERGRG